MVVCKFWTQGNCRKGNSCNFEHPSNIRQNTNNGNANNSGNNSSSGVRSGFFGNANRSDKWQLNDADIESDLTNTRPKWILSAYGPGRDTPAALFVDNEYSPEEIRWRYYQQESTGNGDAADREAQQLWQKAVADMGSVSRNLKDVQKYMEEKERSHPNRYDFCKMDGTISKDEFARKVEGSAQSASSPSPFGGATQAPAANPFSTPASNSSPFGQSSSAFGQPAQPSAFGQARPTPGFGQPAQTSAFGQPAQPSAFGQPAQASAFGQPSQPLAFGKPAFGQSSTPAQPAFGQTGFGQSNANQTSSRFGQPTQNQSPFGAAAGRTGSSFGQTSNLGQTAGAPAASAFGAGSGFGQPAQPSAFGKPAFGATAAPATNTPFGGTAQNANPSPFGAAAQTSNASPFGGAAAQANNASPFGGAIAQESNRSPFGGAAQNAPSGGGFADTNFGNQSNPNPQQQPSPFGQPQSQQAQNANPFAQPQPQNQQPSPFGQPQQPSQQSANPFGQAQQQPQQANPFGQKQPQAQSASPFGQPQQPPAGQNPFGQQPQTGFGAQNQPAPQANQPTSTPFGETVQQPQPTIQSSKPTDKPVRPLHYTQTLPPGRNQTDLSGKLSLYHNQPVQIIETYRPSADGVEVKDTEYPVYRRPDGKGLERIWFPNGLQEPAVQKLVRVIYDFQDMDDAYNQQVKDQYGHLFENGSFKDHVIPLVPPERGWIDYDF